MRIIAAVLFLIGGLETTVMAEDISGKLKLCAACHGKDGCSSQDLIPNLSGQKEKYLLKQLKDFKSGARPNPQMKPIIAGITEAQMEKLATHFAQGKSCP